jgi:hypothetical protein
MPRNKDAETENKQTGTKNLDLPEATAQSTGELRSLTVLDPINNDPEEAKKGCNEFSSATGALDYLTVQDTEQRLTAKGPGTSSRQKKPPTIKNNDFYGK